MHKTYRDWTNDLQSTEVEFENNSMELTSFTTEPTLHWDVKGKSSPLIVSHNNNNYYYYSCIPIVSQEQTSE